MPYLHTERQTRKHPALSFNKIDHKPTETATKQLPLDAEATENETKMRHQELKAAILHVMSNLVHGRMSIFQNNEARGL